MGQVFIHHACVKLQQQTRQIVVHVCFLSHVDKLSRMMKMLEMPTLKECRIVLRLEVTVYIHCELDVNITFVLEVFHTFGFIHDNNNYSMKQLACLNAMLVIKGAIWPLLIPLQIGI